MCFIEVKHVECLYKQDQLNFLVKHQSVPGSLCYPSPGLELGTSGGLCDDFDSLGGGNPNAFSDLGHLNQKVSCHPSHNLSMPSEEVLH